MFLVTLYLTSSELTGSTSWTHFQWKTRTSGKLNLREILEKTDSKSTAGCKFFTCKVGLSTSIKFQYMDFTGGTASGGEVNNHMKFSKIGRMPRILR